MPSDIVPEAEPTRTLSEEESKALLARFGVSFPAEAVVKSAAVAGEAATAIGFPVAIKLNGDSIAHKTERGLVRLSIRSPEAAVTAGSDLLAAARPSDGPVSLLVAPMIRSNREFICGTSTDPQFGPTVLLGVGGILAEVIADVVIRLVPITAADASAMVDELSSQALLEEFRGEQAVDREALGRVLLALSATMEARPEVSSIDLNPVLISGGNPLAVDALVEIRPFDAAPAVIR